MIGGGVGAGSARLAGPPVAPSTRAPEASSASAMGSHSSPLTTARWSGAIPSPSRGSTLFGSAPLASRALQLARQKLSATATCSGVAPSRSSTSTSFGRASRCARIAAVSLARTAACSGDVS